MNITVFPNNEIRLRVAPPSVTRHTSGDSVFSGIVPPSISTIAKNLRFSEPDAVKVGNLTQGLRVGYGGLPRGVDFSVRGRRLMVRCGALLGSGGYGNNVVFLTGTLPGSTVEAFQALASYSSWAVHSLLTRLPRLAGFLPTECRWIWCWEYQKRGALHWHCAMWVPTCEARDRVLRGFTPIWNAVIEGVSRRSGVDVCQREDGSTWANQREVWQSKAEIMRKRADRYLAKYLSKVDSKSGEKSFPPTRWYGISRSLHKELKEKTEVFCTRNAANRHVVEQPEIDIIEWLTNNCYMGSTYGDRVGSGINGVFYLEDGKMSEARRIFGDVERTMELKGESLLGWGTAIKQPALFAIAGRRWLLERYLQDIGPYYRELYERWTSSDPDVPEEEIFWLEYYARRLCYVVGMSYPGQPPERSVAGLPSRDAAKMDAPPPQPSDCPDQPSLFP